MAITTTEELQERLNSWVGLSIKVDKELVDSMIFALAMDSELREAFVAASLQRRREHWAEMEEES